MYFIFFSYVQVLYRRKEYWLLKHPDNYEMILVEWALGCSNYFAVKELLYFKRNAKTK